jgi:Helix-turn-helix domain
MRKTRAPDRYSSGSDTSATRVATQGTPRIFIPDPANGVADAEQNLRDKLLDDFLPKEEAAAELHICERTLDRWRRLGEGPPVTKIGRRVYYRRPTLRAWLRAREQPGRLP